MRPRAPKKSCIDNEVLEARSSMLKYKKQLKHLRSRISRESLALIFGAWSGKKQFTSCWEVFNYGSTLRAGLLRPYASFTSRRQCVRTSLKSAKMRLMVQRLDPINEQQRRTAFSAPDARFHRTHKSAQTETGDTPFGGQCARCAMSLAK